MSLKRICLLSLEEGETLHKHGPLALSCSNHHHLNSDEARGYLSGAELRPWVNNFSYKPMAKNATLPTGAISRRHIIQTLEFHWVKRDSGGMPVMQLVPTNEKRAVMA